MPYKLLQFDFPANGPWGDDMAQAYSGLAEDIARTPGLLWKIWTENPATGEAGGIYLFADDESADAYARMHRERLESFGIKNIRAKKFEVNEPLTRITRGPVSAG